DLLADGRRQATERRGPGLAASTVRLVHSMLSAAFGRAVKRSDLATNPCSRATPPGPSTDETPSWSLAELQEFLAHPEVQSDPEVVARGASARDCPPARRTTGPGRRQNGPRRGAHPRPPQRRHSRRRGAYRPAEDQELQPKGEDRARDGPDAAWPSRPSARAPARHGWRLPGPRVGVPAPRWQAEESGACQPGVPEARGTHRLAAGHAPCPPPP